jgi:hypothetical protein
MHFAETLTEQGARNVGWGWRFVNSRQAENSLLSRCEFRNTCAGPLP